MKTEYHFQPTQPYGLHDMRICSMNIIDGNLHFMFENGFVKLEKPFRQVNGSMTIECIDPDFCTVFLLSKNGESGKFQGEKLALTEFLEKFPMFSFEVVDELYGYHKFFYDGVLSLPEWDYLIEMQLMVYYEGNIIYQTEEESR